RMLLLDEPSSGLDPTEVSHFSELPKRVVASAGIGVMVAEHDMSVIVGICDHVYVLDYGGMIFDGSPASVQASEVVLTAWLVSARGAGRQRSGQDDAAQSRLRPAQALRRTGGGRRDGRHAVEPGAAGASGPLPHTGSERDLPLAHRQGEPPAPGTRGPGGGGR